MNDSVVQPSPELVGRAGHETTDASAMAVGAFALALALMIALVLPILVWMFGRFEAAAKHADPVQSKLTGDQTPPEPRLQTSPSDDLARQRQAEDELLTSYGWIDERQGVVRVPIERAIELLAERGLPEPEGK
ncbi:MAG TPA: hypothetical protein VGX76_07145 [Pirellulales bacterium]|jgi:hypothetical protein|nr:hypothetical protein [Pirellulales bacterium]